MDIEKQFLPQNEIVNVLTKDVIREILRQKLMIQDIELNNLVGKISGTGSGTKQTELIKIFAILVLIDRVDYIQEFIKAGFCDKDLPFTNKGDLYPSNDVHEKRFHNLTRLPFLETEVKSYGGQGEVSKVTIHHAHIYGHSLKHSLVAVKRFDKAHRDHWNDEIKALTRYSGSNTGHAHLIKLLAAYEWGEKGLYLIFPLAEGNLADFWKGKSSRSSSFKDACWLIEQCRGITAGLCKIHSHDSWPGDKLGRHGDIKPENILWFRDSSVDQGLLLVADFTLARFHTTATVNNTMPGKRGCTQTFRPPEVDFAFQTQAAQRYDVWSLGCVLLEFIAWYLLGYDAIREKTYIDDRGQQRQGFNDARVEDDDCHTGFREDKYFNGLHNDFGHSIIVKESVTEWVELLHRSKHCSEAMHTLLEFIINSMLVTNPAERCTMQEVLVQFNTVHTKIKNVEYTYQGVPRTELGDDPKHPEFKRGVADLGETYQTLALRDSRANPETSGTMIPDDHGMNSDYQKVAQLFSDDLPEDEYITANLLSKAEGSSISHGEMGKPLSRSQTLRSAILRRKWKALVD
ncbi:putative Protein kinase domain-containing protein [Seiridium unicorne]|uniref:Protein kinase domain-containing protein n=1 Tax=Seiridium unicorne TaxID=138068 RepID=A0ABR2UIU9_9PEZI